MINLMYLRQLNPESVVIRLVLAAIFGGMIGLERGRKRRPAGFRTYMLVCIGAALAMLLGQYAVFMAAQKNLSADATRIGAQVINGIGFIGAGTIIVTGHQAVKGVTTAAGLWACACMGLAIGAGFYECVFLGFLLIFLVMRILPGMEALMIEKSRVMSIYIELESLDFMGSVLEQLKAQNLQIFEMEIDRGHQEPGKNPSAIFTMHMEKHVSHTQVLAALSDLNGICTIDEI